MGRIGSKPLTAGLVLLLAASAVPQEGPVFRADVRLVRLLVTVKDNLGRLTGSLEKEDFTVSDNGVPQEIAVFERRTGQPLSVTLLIDTSSSTGKELRYEIASVERFLKALFGGGNPHDEASIIDFNDEVILRASFTRRMERLRSALRELKPGGGTSVYDAIYLACGNMEGRDGRHVIVAVTDGGNTTSYLTYQDALQAIHRADAVFYGIVVLPVTNDPGRNIGGENALASLAASSGGRVFYPSAGPALDEAFGEILRDLRTQYLLAYYRKNVPPSKDRFHRIEVTLRQPDLRALSRNGYYEDSDRSGLPERPGWRPARRR